MSRRKAAPKRKVLPDPLFKSEMVTQFVNRVMQRGKKSLAESIVYGAFEIILGGSKDTARQILATSEESRRRVIEQFNKALDGVSPRVEVKSRRVGGSTYQVPVEIRPDRRKALGMRWLVEFAMQRKEKTMQERLAGEILDALNGRGGAVKKREDTHKMADANKAFAHYRW